MSETINTLFPVVNFLKCFDNKFGVFGPQTKKLLTLINVHPNGIFRETISRPLWGAAP